MCARVFIHRLQLSGTSGDSMEQQKARNYGMSLSNEVNMINCYKHCKHFFEKCKSIHFNVLIAYWMMAGYLGPIDSVEKAYERGHKLLLDLTYQEDSMLKPSDKSHETPEMIIFKESTKPEPILCSRHKGLCITEEVGFVDMVDLVPLGDFVVLTEGMLRSVARITDEFDDESDFPEIPTSKKRPDGSVLLVDGDHLSRQVFHSPRKLRYLAYFKPRPKSLNLLLNNVTQHLSVLLLRDCELLTEIDFHLERFRNLTVLEISGLSHVANLPLDKISELVELRCLNISDLLIETLPKDFFTKLVKLEWIILRGCSNLIRLPSVKLLKSLKLLDLSHCSALNKSVATVFDDIPIQIIDLSYTSMATIPTLKKSSTLTHLFMRNTKVAVLSSLNPVTSLEVLDLSGAESLKEIKQLEGNTNLRILDLSRTKITSIDFLHDLIHLRDLILRKCAVLTQLPAVDKLSKLEVLDISGCISLSYLPEVPSNLKELNISLTKVNYLPSFQNPTSLVKLSLRDLELYSLESLASLTTLKELDLNNVQINPPQPQGLTFDFMQYLVNLQILDLSKTSVAYLPYLSKLKNLRKLFLADCQHLVVPDLQTLTDLETLDLSLAERAAINNSQQGTEIEDQKHLPLPSGLKKLVLKNRSGVENLFSLTSHDKLEDVDLSGTDVKQIPYKIVAQANCIQLPAKIGLSRVRLSRMGALQEDNLQWQSADCTDMKIISAIGDKSRVSTAGKGDEQFFRLKEGNQGSWEAFIHHFSVSLSPPKDNKDGVFHLDRDEFILIDDLSWGRRLLNLDLNGRSVEIHGFSELTDKIRIVLELADNVALVGNSFLVKREDDVSSAGDNVLDSSFHICSKAMKVCCVRRCPKMKAVLNGKEKKDGIAAECLERLVLSDLANLESICANSVSSESIASLKHLYIDCCPKLNKAIIATQEPKNLETLHIKFCDKLQNLFDADKSLNNLQKLSLFELPELEVIETKLPKLEILIIMQCAKLKNLDRVIESASASLTQLTLDSCHGLNHVLPSSSSALLEKLQAVKISSCSGMVTLFDSTIASSSSCLNNLQTLRLWKLPKLKSIGGELSLASTPDLDPALPPCIRQQLRFPGQQNTNLSS